MARGEEEPAPPDATMLMGEEVLRGETAEKTLSYLQYVECGSG